MLNYSVPEVVRELHSLPNKNETYYLLSLNAEIARKQGLFLMRKYGPKDVPWDTLDDVFRDKFILNSVSVDFK